MLGQHVHRQRRNQGVPGDERLHETCDGCCRRNSSSSHTSLGQSLVDDGSVNEKISNLGPGGPLVHKITAIIPGTTFLAASAATHLWGTLRLVSPVGEGYAHES